MKIKEIVDRVVAGKEYAEWAKDHKNCFLAHVYFDVNEFKSGICQLGFYDPDKEDMHTFFVENGEVKEMKSTDEIVRSGGKIVPLDMEQLDVPVEDAFKKAHEEQQSKYPGNDPIKVFCIVQHIGENQVFNITFVTKTFSTLNIRVDTLDGSVVESSLQSLINMDDGK